MSFAELADIVEFRALTEPLRGEERYSPFDAPFGSTVKTLAREIDALKPRTSILEVAIPSHALRNDGLPRADARASSPGVILTLLDTKTGATAIVRKGRRLIDKLGGLNAALKATHPDRGGDEEDFIAVVAASRAPQMRFRCATFHTWQDNVRAIALGMEALRKVERYGITELDQQYAGFMQLNAGHS